MGTSRSSGYSNLSLHPRNQPALPTWRQTDLSLGWCWLDLPPTHPPSSAVSLPPQQWPWWPSEGPPLGSQPQPPLPPAELSRPDLHLHLHCSHPALPSPVCSSLAACPVA